MSLSSMVDEKGTTAHHEMALTNNSINELSQAERVASLMDKAKQATNAEHDMTVKEALKYHKKAIFWSMVMSATIIMEGYDNILMSSFFAYPSFQKKYGVPAMGNTNFKEDGKLLWDVLLLLVRFLEFLPMGT